MSDQRQDNDVPPPGLAGNSATIAWTQNAEDATGAEEAATSADAALEQIDKLIGRINSTSSVAVTAPLVAPDDGTVRHSGPHDDAALQDYMDQFLERVTGKKKPEAEGGVPGQTVLPAPITRQEPEKQREIKRAPESVQDMSLMRELANESARRALGAHAGQRLISGTRNSFLGALSLSFISSLLAVTSIMGQVGWAWSSAVLVMLLALVLTGRFLLLRGQLQKLNAYDRAPAPV